MADTTEALVERVTRALSELDLRVLGDLDHGFQNGLELLDEARDALIAALADNRVEESELLQVRHTVLRAIAALRPFTPLGGSRSERLLKIVGAFKGVADCFIEFDVPVRARDVEASILLEDRIVTLGEFSLELFEAKVEQLLETIQDLGDLEEAAVPQTATRTENMLSPAIAYLQGMYRYAIPGCVYGAQARRENPYLAARALRAACARIQDQLLSRYGVQEPLDRLSKLEVRLTAFIEQVRTAGSPIEEPEGWLRRFRASRLDALRGMHQDLSEIEQQLKERTQDREQ